MPQDKSRLRQGIRALEEARQRQLEIVVGEHGPLIRGSVGQRQRVCGHPACRCTEGELHKSKYLSAAVQGRTRMVHLPEADVMHVTAATQRYRRFRRARTQLARLAAEVARLADRLGEALLEAYPPGDPLPPAARRGRKAGHARRKS